MTTYFGILTKVGEAKEANAKALGVPVKIAEMEVGDGGGVLPVPDREQTSLIGSKHRAPINRIFVDPSNPAWLVVEQVIPEQFGGWWARELGLRDADGDLIAVSNCPPTYKPQMAEGSARTQVVRMVLQVSSTSNFTLKIDPAVVLATRGYVDEETAKRLGKDETAAAAKKLAVARQLSISGAATAAPKPFDGQSDVDLVLGNLDMDKASKGTLTVSRGGTGLAAVAEGHLLVGAQGGKLRAAALGTLPPDGRYPLIFSVTALPRENVGPIIVAECGEVWIWIQTAFYTGYRSPLCGRPLDGHTITPLASELDATGGTVPKADYPGLWGYAQENALVLTQADWEARRGGHYFVNVDATHFRVPDLRDMFRRFTGTDADTANARALGSRQADAMKAHAHTLILQRSGGGINTPMRVVNGGNNMWPFNANGSEQEYVARDSSDGVSPTGGTENRGRNTAYHPRIHA
ncbi:phage tail protein [Achromobacter xylosoxidans]